MTLTRFKRLRPLPVALALAWGLPAQAASVYFNDFQGMVGPEWSHTGVASAPNPDYAGTRLFLGEFGNDTVSLSLGALPEHGFVTVAFDLYVINSWDGNDTTSINNQPLGPDRWQLSVFDGPVLLDTTFSNGNPAGQAYAPSPFASGCTPYAPSATPGVYAPMTGASECYSLGYFFNDPIRNTNEAMDSVYSLEFTFAHAVDDLRLDFAAFGLQSLADESWGLDNVQVSIAPIPLPASAGLLAAGLAVLGAWRRRAVQKT
jgi:hypothetical protein